MSETQRSNWKILSKNWIHIVTWGMMILYFIVAPGVNARFFTQEGKSIQVNAQLPVEVNESKSFVDRIEVYDEQNGIYQLLGWAFLTIDKNIPSSDYERLVVLRTLDKNSVFEAGTFRRIDVQLAYNDLGMDVANSGFSALIDSNLLKPGLFRVGIIFKHILDDSAFYTDTDFCIKRTPNKFILERLTPDCHFLTVQNEGQPFQVNAKIPTHTGGAESWIDTVDAETKGSYRISGWAFLKVDNSFSVGDYERQVVLYNLDENYIFSTDTTLRKDVQEHFSNLKMSLSMSGFSALIDSNALRSGVYGIGVIFKHNVSDMVYYIETNRCLTRTAKGLTLEIPGSPTCPTP